MKAKFYNPRPGETLAAIARRAGIRLPLLRRMNRQVRDSESPLTGTILLPEDASRTDVFRDAAEADTRGDEPLWLKIARRETGTAEWERGSNPRIVEYLSSVTTLARDRQQDDNTAWCAAFVNWCLTIAGETPRNSAWALDWARWGRAASPPRIGVVVVWKRTFRGQSGGHVGFYLSETPSQIEVIGGNQGNSVSVRRYPKNGMSGETRYEFVSYRMP